MTFNRHAPSVILLALLSAGLPGQANAASIAKRKAASWFSGAPSPGG